HHPRQIKHDRNVLLFFLSHGGWAAYNDVSPYGTGRIGQDASPIRINDIDFERERLIRFMPRNGKPRSNSQILPDGKPGGGYRIPTPTVNIMFPVRGVRRIGNNEVIYTHS